MAPKITELPAVFLAAFATLLFEITVTKMFEFSLWANYAFLVISTAMFGLGLSGVILTRWPGLLQIREDRFLVFNTALSAATMLGAALIINFVPIHLPDAPSGWRQEMTHVAVVFLALGLPFMFFGFMISFLLDKRAEQANVYYFADLFGAGLGAFAPVILIHALEPQGLVVLSFLLAMVAAGLFLLSGDQHGPARLAAAGAVTFLAVAGIIFWAPRAADQVELNVHVKKRGYMADENVGRLEKSGWSVLSRVDIAAMGDRRKRVWIAGGINESSIAKFDGDFPALRSQREAVMPRKAGVLDYKTLPYLSKQDPVACIIGTSGGEDALEALRVGARKVVGVEMDPMIVKFVTEDYSAFAGNLFNDGDYSEIIVDEGRSYLQRSGRRFDVIQQINNFTPIAFQNGALNLSETYLLTVESFKAFHDHLTDDGILAISRYGSIRLLSIAIEMFRQMGVPREAYAKHLFVGEGPAWVINTFMMKKSPFTRQEIDDLFRFYNVGHGRRILYAPYRTDDLPDLANNLYYKMVTAEDPSRYWRIGCFNFEPPTDNKPFFNRMKILGKNDAGFREMPQLPGEVRYVESENQLRGRVPPGDLPPVIVLIEALVFSILFFGGPLLSKRRLRQDLRGSGRVLGFFACLGVGFIFIEICLIQQLVLFLGAPVYSIAAVLSSLLVFAGLGSLASGHINAEHRSLTWLMVTVAGVVLLLQLLLPVMMSRFLGAAFGVRMTIALLFTGVMGFFMGMPMPTGIRLIRARNIGSIPWAWATNGFFTVIGSALAVMVASNTGFTSVFYIAVGLYAVSPLFFSGSR